MGDFSRCAFCGRDLWRPLWAARNITDTESGAVIGADPEAVGLCCIARVPLTNRLQLEDPKPVPQKTRVGTLGNGPALPGLAAALATVGRLTPQRPSADPPAHYAPSKPAKPPKPRLDYNDVPVPPTDTRFEAEARQQLAANELFPTTAQRLLHLTRGCRHDMHEPDEQGVSAKVVGVLLDNANGDAKLSSELRVVVMRDGIDGAMGETATLNLASLLALARIGGAVVCDALKAGLASVAEPEPDEDDDPDASDG